MIYEEKGNKDVYPTRKLTVLSHGIHNDRIVLLYEDMEIVVIAKDLHAAITNACNTGG
jgi:hypothetical protein